MEMNGKKEKGWGRRKGEEERKRGRERKRGMVIKPEKFCMLYVD